MPAQIIELPFPVGGVQRRTASRQIDSTNPPTTAWAVNVRAEGAEDRRLRGGSRAGLTKFVNNDFGTTIADMISINTASTSGAAEMLAVLHDSTLSVVESGTVTSPVAYLTNGSGDVLTDAAGNKITVSGSSAPATGFLLAGQQHVFAVGSSAIVKMDPKTGKTDNVVATDGTVPTGMTFGAIYRDRLFLSGSDNAIYASKQGDYSNWNFGEHYEDEQRAVAFQLSLASDVGALPTAMIPSRDGSLICATRRSLWVVRGDPTTGELVRISENVGIMGSRAWVKADEQIVFLAEDGLYQVNADGSEMSPLTPQAIPEELRNVDTSTVTVSLGYDHERLAFHIFLRTAAGSDTHWIYERQNQAFWPVRMANDHTPLVACQHKGDLLLAGNDGYIRKVDGANDDGTAIQSHVLIGPVRLGSLDFMGIVNTINGIIANNSGEITWRIVVGSSADSATDNGKLAIEAFQSSGDYTQYVRSSGCWNSDRSTTGRPRSRGMWACVWLQSWDQWAFEGATMEVSQAGKWRG